ncbi:MAG: hypothetical protein Q9221_001003 [Calogaya cf. arnoldii]
MACSTTPSRIRLAQLLQEAHETHRYNTRKIEESYHALRASTRRLDVCYTNYCKELERELDVEHWKDLPRGPPNIEVLEQHQPVTNVDRTGGEKFPDLPSPERSSRHPPCSSTPRARPRSSNLPPPQPQPQHSSPNVQGPRAMAEPTNTFPSPYKTAPSSRQRPAPYEHELQGPRPIASPTDVTPRRHASLPTREYLVALSTNGPLDSHPPQQKHINRASAPDATERPRHSSQPVDAYYHSNEHRGSEHRGSGNAHYGNANHRDTYHGHANHGNGDYSNAEHGSANRGYANHDHAHHGSTNQTTGQKYTVDAFKNPMTHEALNYQPGVQGHWGSPSTGQYEDQGSTRNHGSSGRARLHKRS